jgi:hypothetical protein
MSYMSRTFRVMEDLDLGREVWARYDAMAEVFTLATDKNMEHLIGEAESASECKRVASCWFEELRTG